VRPETYWLIRHGESTWNAAGRWQGQLDPPLSVQGRSQATCLAAVLRAEDVELIVASDLARCVETATIVCGQLGLPLELNAALRELDAGSWAGLTRREIGERDAEALVRFDSGDPDAPAGGAESRRDVARRVRRGLRSLAVCHPGRRVAVVTHGGVIRALLPEARPANAECHRVDPARLLAVAGGES
jgi:broad specificity phosphatase PhoE